MTTVWSSTVNELYCILLPMKATDVTTQRFQIRQFDRFTGWQLTRTGNGKGSFSNREMFSGSPTSHQ
jgi:hypothetical protein